MYKRTEIAWPFLKSMEKCQDRMEREKMNEKKTRENKK